MGVAFNGVGILNDFLMASDIVEAQNLIVPFHDFAHLAQLVLIVGGKYYLFHIGFQV
jgi:hypothetical protein